MTAQLGAPYEPPIYSAGNRPQSTFVFGLPTKVIASNGRTLYEREQLSNASAFEPIESGSTRQLAPGIRTAEFGLE